MSQDIDGDRAILRVKIGVLMVPEPVVSSHLVDKNERNPLTVYLIGYRRVAWMNRYSVIMSQELPLMVCSNLERF
jgi:hypothetical protein